MPFRGLVAETQDGAIACKIENLTRDDLHEGDVVVAVRRSSVNYKDGLAITGRGKVLHRFPMIPGIDLAGEVVVAGGEFRIGDRVLATGYGIGESHTGGYAEEARLRSNWLVPLPKDLTYDRAMAIGTAGLTAMLAVRALESGGVDPRADRPVLVTGAGGGVGGLAVSLLSKAGYKVAASTGRAHLADSLAALGATEIVSRADLDGAARPLESQRWSGVVDSVGGQILARALAETALQGTVAACGLAASADLHTTVMPFILRGVQLVGIDSNWCPMARRREAWRRVANELGDDVLQPIVRHVALDDVFTVADEILAGQVHGRVVVDISR